MALAACTMANDHREAALLHRRLRRDQWHAFVGNDIGRGGRRVTVGFASLRSRSPRPWPTALRGSAAAAQPSWLWPARHGTGFGPWKTAPSWPSAVSVTVFGRFPPSLRWLPSRTTPWPPGCGPSRLAAPPAPTTEEKLLTEIRDAIKAQQR